MEAKVMVFSNEISQGFSPGGWLPSFAPLSLPQRQRGQGQKPDEAPGRHKSQQWANLPADNSRDDGSKYFPQVTKLQTTSGWISVDSGISCCVNVFSTCTAREWVSGALSNYLIRALQLHITAVSTGTEWKNQFLLLWCEWITEPGTCGLCLQVGRWQITCPGSRNTCWG